MKGTNNLSLKVLNVLAVSGAKGITMLIVAEDDYEEE